MSEGSLDLELDERGLIASVVQDHRTGRVLMVAYMNRESLEKTLETGEAHFWSRSRGELWHKGASSGNVMKVIELLADCDRDCLLLRVESAGPACHTGEMSCFFTPIGEKANPSPSLGEILSELAEVIGARAVKPPSRSYTAALLEAGVDRIAKKVGEEAVEVVIAGKNQDPEELARESADLLYHLLVLWEQGGVSLSAVADELGRRRR